VRRGAVLALAAALLVAGCGGHRSPEAVDYVAQASRLDPVFGRAASSLAGGKVEVRCWSQRAWPSVERLLKRETGSRLDVAGAAHPAQDTIDLAPYICHDLVRFATDHDLHRVNEASLVVAIDVLAHESNHLAGSRAGATEADVECNALQTARRAARLLGAGPALAARIARTDWIEVYPQQPAGYRSPHCRPGGKLDLHPGGSWP
jgi:hypothetical protein